MKRRLIVYLLSAVALACFSEIPDQKVLYNQTPQGELKLHDFNPDGHSDKDRAPAIVFFFGGGWHGGSPGHFYAQSEHMASCGMVAICPGSTLINNHHQ